MMHLSSYYSNCKSANTWTEKVNLIGEKVLKPRINFCEYCNKPILVYGRLIPCKHVFCFTCANLCMANTTSNNNNYLQTNELTNQLSTPNSKDNEMNSRDHFLENNSRQQLNQSSSFAGQASNISDSLSNNISADHLNRSTQSNVNRTNQSLCHRCGGRALRIERNALGSVFVCQVVNCRRTYLSARDLQAHITHRHNKNNNHSYRINAATGSLAAISSSPFISSSTLNHLSSQTHSNHHTSNHATASPSTNSNHHNRENRNGKHSNRDAYQRERERERDSKEYHRQSLQRAAQWAEASASILEKGFNR